MTVRARIHLNGRDATVTLYQGLQESADHLFLKLAAALFFFDRQASVQMGATDPALQGQEYFPDFMATDVAGAVTLWIECGKTTVHKLQKVSKRFRDARILVLTAQPQQALQQAQDAASEGLRNVEAWSFPRGAFGQWMRLAGEQNDIIGEANETSLNVVINGGSFVVDLERAVP
jgi:uncharacterized protein YaeQ